jgi:hypothetical protein
MQPRPADTTTGPSMPGSSEPAEGRPDLGLPGADQQDIPSDRNEDLPEKLGQRIENGSSSGIATGEPDVLPDVEVPEATM